MCVLSMVFDYGRQTFPVYPPPVPYAPPFIPQVPTPDQWKEFRELVEKAKKFDEITGQPDCEDPEKGRWMADIEDRLRRLEGT